MSSPTRKRRGAIEPQIKSQWFVRMKPLAEKALEKIKSGEISYIPDQYEKITTHWLNNIIDWNISRQIVWGISIPAKICDSCDIGIVDLEDKEKTCKKCGKDLRKDTDTFDTWFSSSQWPFASLGYPDSKDFKEYYPTDLMETAGEIIFFWVSRMIMLGLYITDKVPFKKVYLHGLVLDAKGQKMSKSKGNVINPLDLTKKYGTDAFRMGLIIGNTPGTSLALSEDKIRAYKNFANKLWNITRYVLTATEGEVLDSNYPISKELLDLVADVTTDIENYRLYLAGEKLYHYAWHEFADVLIEKSKPILKDGSDAEKKEQKQFLLSTLATLLKALHPFIPYVTEEIWKDMPVKDRKLLMIEKWPN
jgi:valyl-tRNA synthetase